MMRRFDVALPTWASAGEGSLVPQLVPGVRPSLPCPRAFLLRPANGRLDSLVALGGIVGKRFELTLFSELSGKSVATKTLLTGKEWIKWLGPVAAILILGLRLIPLAQVMEYLVFRVQADV